MESVSQLYNTCKKRLAVSVSRTTVYTCYDMASRKCVTAMQLSYF